MKISFFALALVVGALLSGYGMHSQSQPSGPAPKFDHLTLPVADVARSVRFYEGVIGLHRVPDPFNAADIAFMALNERDQLHLSSGPPQPTSRSVHFAFSVASLPAFQQRLEQASIRYQDANGATGKANLRPDGVHQIYFQDPDGYWIEVNDRK
jgi:lactoylglutathione lyase